jgi:hypothetical protein
MSFCGAAVGAADKNLDYFYAVSPRLKMSVWSDLERSLSDSLQGVVTLYRETWRKRNSLPGSIKHCRSCLS